ncbi:MAG: hypothetical protein GTN36_02430 [Candidatus Aenigmarchaeota archaeon]|nr:hypothetical protein [Candidatus Aenigmarchaeota archaeon]
MFDKIQSLIKEKKLTPTDCAYHTLRTLENNGKVRALAIKGEDKLHIELICPFCGAYSYVTQEWIKVSKGSKFRFRVKCPKCEKLVKITKLKGKK